MIKKMKYFVSIIFAVAMTACGGGGGGGSSQSANQTVASTDSFPLRAANATSIQQAATLTFTLSGTSSGVSLTGSGTITNSSVTSTTFNGVTALTQTGTTNGSFTANGTTFPLTSTSVSYMDSNYLPLGSSGSEYEFVNGTANVPVTVKVGDSGTIYVANRYSDASKSTLLGTDTSSFEVLADTASTALVKTTNVYRDTSSNVTKTDTTTVRITPSGGSTYVSGTSLSANGNTLNLAFH